MTMPEYDPELTRWGLHQLICYPKLKSGCQSDSCCETRDYAEVKDDEAIACVLQEEFLQISIAETSGTSQVSEFDKFWDQKMKHVLGDDEAHEDEDGPVYSSSSSPENYSGANEWLELAEDFHTEEVGKRLTQLASAPHVPRINKEVPSTDESVSDHQRLIERLHVYDLVERKVEGDGNCQFRALSDQFYRTPEHHKFVRKQIVKQLKSHPELYEGYVPMTFTEYLKKMSSTGEWGDHVTLQAAADSYGVKIFVFTSFKDTCCIEILPAVQKSNRVILLSFWAEVHYNSIYPDGGAELPEEDLRRKKRWWPFGH